MKLHDEITANNGTINYVSSLMTSTSSSSRLSEHSDSDDKSLDCNVPRKDKSAGPSGNNEIKTHY